MRKFLNAITEIFKSKKSDLTENIKKINSYGYLSEEYSKVEDTNFIQDLSYEEMIDMSKDIMAHPFLKFSSNLLLSFLKEYKYSINSDNDEINEFVLENIDKFHDEIISSFFQGVENGFSVTSPTYVVENGKIKWSKINDLGSENLKFNSDFELINKVELQKGNLIINEDTVLTDLEGRKLFIYTHNMKEGNRYGWGKAITCYYLWSMLTMNEQEWTLYNRKVSIPSYFVLYDSEENFEGGQSRAAILAEAMRSLRSGSGGALSNVREIVKLEPSTSSWNSYKDFKDDLKKEILQAWLGSYLIAETAKTGSYTTSSIHNETTKRFAFSILTEMKKIYQQMINYLVELNYPNLALENYPKLEFYFEEIPGINEIIEFLKIGIPLKKDALVKNYNIPIAFNEDEKDNIIQISQNIQNSITDSFFFSRQEKKNKEE